MRCKTPLKSMEILLKSHGLARFGPHLGRFQGRATPGRHPAAFADAPCPRYSASALGAPGSTLRPASNGPNPARPGDKWPQRRPKTTKNDEKRARNAAKEAPRRSPGLPSSARGRGPRSAPHLPRWPCASGELKNSPRRGAGRGAPWASGARRPRGARCGPPGPWRARRRPRSSATWSTPEARVNGHWRHSSSYLK